MKQLGSNRWPILALIAGLVVVVIGIGIFSFQRSNQVVANLGTSNEKTNVEELKKPEIDFTAPDYTDRDIPQTRDLAHATQSKVSNGQQNFQQSPPRNSNYKEFFKNDAFLGDSISEGLFYFDFLDENRVIAEKGLSITKGIDEADKVIALNPNNVFVLFGVNDIDDRTSSSWIVEQYTTLVKKLKTRLPNSQIYVLSILPVLESQVKNPHINNAHIKECNAGLNTMASQEDVHFVNLGLLLNDNNKNLYAGDGIHFKPDFYSLWLNYLEDILGKK
ncbi:MAG: GDSL-type esterase/lipase family protein [Bacillota bacterium]|nr:GDSL-type esterase/lipase family protein [Bacillota bacterium]